MKKGHLVLVSTLLLNFFMIKAQNTDPGDIILNLGFGLGNNYTSGGSEFSNSIPPISASVELILKDGLFSDGKGALGVGGFVQYMKYKYLISNSPTTDGGVITSLALKSTQVSASGSSKWKYNKFIIGPRGYFHYSLLDKLDTYTGLMLGLDFVSWGNGNASYTHTAFGWAWFVGGRYYFNDNLAGMLELGYGATYANIGIAYKIGKIKPISFGKL